jgi:hypothetical protein
LDRNAALNQIGQCTVHTFPSTRTGVLRAKASAPTAALQPQQAKTRGEIPIAPALPPVHTFRDFVPWRFSAAGRLSAQIEHHPGSRKPAQERTHALQQKRPRVPFAKSQS